MEVFDLFIVILPIFLVILVRFVLNNSPIPEDDIRQAQIELDEISEFNKKYLGNEIFYDAKEELMFGVIAVKGIILFLLGLATALLTFFLQKNGYLLDYCFSMVASSVFLITYGLAFASRKKFAPIIFFGIFIFLLFFLFYYFNLEGLTTEKLQMLKVSSFVLILGFLFFLIIPRIEKDEE